MSKRAGEFLKEEYSSGRSKKPKLNKDDDLLPIPVLNVGEDWNIFRASLEDYFSSTGIDDDVRKVSTLIASLELEVYQTMFDFSELELLNQKTFEQFCQAMNKRYSEVLVFEMRKEFNRMQQLSSENISQWFNRVKESATQCICEQLDERIKD